MTVDTRKEGKTRFRASRRGPQIWRRLAGLLAIAAVTFTLVGVFSPPARADVRFYLGLGLPLYPAYPAYPADPYVSAPYPYAYSYPYPPPPAAYRGYGVVAPPVVAPPAWVGGYWGWRHDRWGHRSRVWVRGHRH
jgi:hypothetical protein